MMDLLSQNEQYIYQFLINKDLTSLSSCICSLSQPTDAYETSQGSSAVIL